MEQDTGVDDLISMGGGGFAPALGAPVLAPQKEGLSLVAKIGIIGGGVVVLAIIVVLLVVALSKGGDDETMAQLAKLQEQLAAALFGDCNSSFLIWDACFTPSRGAENYIGH